MPKLIEDAKNKILKTAESQLFSLGYKKLTMRGVAKCSGVAPSTIYNYFSNKEMLVATIMAEDWAGCLGAMKRGCNAAQSIDRGIKSIYGAIAAFCEKYESVWEQYSFLGNIPSGFGARHLMLRAQITEQLVYLLERFGQKKEAALAPLFAETLLACATQKDIDYSVLEAFSKRLFETGETKR